MIQMANNQLSYVASHYILGKVSLAIELKISPFSFFSLTSKTSYSSFFLLPMKIIFGATCCFFLFKLIPLLDLCRQPEFYLELNRKENSEEVRNACMCTHASLTQSTLEIALQTWSCCSTWIGEGFWRQEHRASLGQRLSPAKEQLSRDKFLRGHRTCWQHVSCWSVDITS